MSLKKFDLKKLREALNLSQQEMGQKLGVTQPVIAQWEKSGKISIEAALRIGIYFDIPYEKIIKI